MTFKRISLVVISVILAVLVLIAAAGHYKFNIFGDDVYFDAASVSRADLVGSWSVTEDPLNSEMHLFTDGSVRMVSNATTEYGTWGLSEGQLLLDTAIEGALEEMSLSIVSWNDARLILQTVGRGDKTLVRLTGTDALAATPSLNCPGGLEAGSQIAFGDYAVPSGEIDSVAFDIRDRVPQIDLSVSETVAYAIKVESAKYLGQPLPITLNGVLIASPVSQEEIAPREIQIYFRDATVPFVFDALSANCPSN